MPFRAVILCGPRDHGDTGGRLSNVLQAHWTLIVVFALFLQQFSFPFLCDYGNPVRLAELCTSTNLDNNSLPNGNGVWA